MKKVLIKKEQNISTTTHYYKSNVINDEFYQAYLLLNGNECDKPMDCYCKLVELWKIHRDTNIKFNQSMIDWIFDFCYLNSIECKIFEEEDITLPSQSVIKDIIIDYYLQGKPLHLPLSVLNSICVDSLTNNAFYRGGHNKQVHDIIPNVISFVDLELTRRYGYGIAQKYAPIYEETKTYYPFMHVNGKPIQSIQISTKNYTTNKQRNNIELALYLNNLARFSENKLMELCGYRGRLKNVFLDEVNIVGIVTFNNHLANQAYRIICDSIDLVDVKNDLDKINIILSSAPTKENLFNAVVLNDKLRKKYPIIDDMLEIANSLTVAADGQSNDLLEYAKLKQDIFGILLHVLIKKNIIKNIEDFIDYIAN